MRSPCPDHAVCVLCVQESVEPMVLELGGEGGAPASLDSLWSGQRNFPPIVDIPPDADDETMVELAIALSLQDQVGVCWGGDGGGGVV